MDPMKFSNDSSLNKAQQFMFWAVIGIGAAVLIGLLLGTFLQFLWNATITVMFETIPITFWQAIGIFILAKLLFGFGTSSSSSSSKGKKRSKRFGRRRKGDAEDSSDAAEGDDFEVEDFRDYWQREGKAAYDAYRDGTPDSDKPNSTDEESSR